MSSRLIGMFIVLVTVVAAAACAGTGSDSSSVIAPSTVPTSSNPDPGYEPMRFVVFKGDFYRVGGRTPTGFYGYATSTNLAQAKTAAENFCLQAGGAFCGDLGTCTHYPPSGSRNRSWAFAYGPYEPHLGYHKYVLTCERPNESEAAALALSSCNGLATVCRPGRSGTTN